MRILVLNWQDRENPQGGGAELHLHEIFGRIAAQGHTVDLACSGFRGAPSRVHLDGIHVHRIGGRHTYPFLVHRYYRKHLASRRYDVVVEDINKIPLYTPLWDLPPTVALVHHLFGTTAFREAPAPLAAAVWLAERPIGRIYRNVQFQAVSESTAEDLVDRGVNRGAIRVIYNGVDSRHLTPDESKRSPTPLFVYMGRLKKYKRVDIVISALAAMTDSSARLHIAGSGDDRHRLEAHVKKLGLGGRVRFLGRISEDEKLQLLRSAWASVLASPKEGWGISNLEAAACGTPVVAANSPGIRESVLDGRTGYLVQPDSVQLFARSLDRIAGDPALVSSLGAEARRFAERFTWDAAAEQTFAHLQEAASGLAPPHR